MKSTAFVVALFLAVASATVYFEEDFSQGMDNWVVSQHKPESERGAWALSPGKYSVNENNVGLQTTEDARFYQISTEIEDFSNKDKDLVLQFSVAHEQNIDCGGGYVKLMPAGLDQEDFHGESPYNIMFGPDICGSTRRVHVIFNYKGENHLIKHNINAETDEDRHLYTLVVHPDQTYEVLVDNEERKSGSLLDDWDFLPPKKIKDPKASKPEDWVDEAEIPDPEDKKPEGWDDIPAQIVDPEAEKPEDWDDELDGEWEAPLIDNPDYQGEWKPKMIPNPDYKGPWEHPLIDNPDYEEDDQIYAYDSHKYLGIEIWQVKSGTIFDDFLVTDDVDVAREAAEKFLERQKEEIELRKKKQEEERAAAADEDEATAEDFDDLDLDDMEDMDLGEDDFHDEL